MNNWEAVGDIFIPNTDVVIGEMLKREHTHIPYRVVYLDDDCNTINRYFRTRDAAVEYMQRLVADAQELYKNYNADPYNWDYKVWA